MASKKKNSWFIKENVTNGRDIILFTSDEGKTVFFEANDAGFLNSYFELAQQFLTSFEPAYSCGLASLAMVLNTLGVDPCKVWKDMYRWYDETMLDHCVPYNIIVNHGLVIQQFACMVECNYLEVELACQAKSSASLDQFRAICKEMTSLERCDRILVCSYSRVSLDQQGCGHYCPIGGYHPKRDLLLVFDISRYKYPLHWVPLESLWKAMTANDPDTGSARGYFVLRRPTKNNKPSHLFKIGNTLNMQKRNHSGWIDFFNTVLLPWHHWMSKLEGNCVDQDLLLGNVIRELLENLSRSNCWGVGHLNGVHICLQFQDADPSLGKECLVCELRKSLETIIFYKYVRDQIHARHHDALCSCWARHVPMRQDAKSSRFRCCQIDIQLSSCHLRDFTLVHFVVMILLSWPYDMKVREGKRNGLKPSSISSTMALIISTELSNLDNVALKTEVQHTKQRFLGTR